MSQRTVLSALAAVGLLVGCGSDSSEGTTETSSEQTTTEATDAAETSPPGTTTPPAGSSDPATSSSPDTSAPTTAAAPEPIDEPVSTDTDADADASATSDPADTDSSPTSDAPETELVELSTPIPPGSFRAVAPGDAIVLGTDGDLELRPRLIGTITDPAIPLVDNPDPDDGSDDGTGPNVIDDVAGFANGSLIYGDCCEPASGNVYALPEAGAEPALIGAGFDPDLSPNGERLVTANSMMISVTSVGDGSGSGLLLNHRDDQRFFDVADVQWSTDDEIALLSRSGDGEFMLTAFDAGTLEETNSVVLSSADGADPDDVSFAGFGPDDTLAVSTTGATETTIRFYQPDTLAELDATRTLPSSVSSVAFVPGDLGLTWVDGNVLYYLPSGQLEPSALANDVLAAWPLEPGLVT